jgi:WD40 repeat protein
MKGKRTSKYKSIVSEEKSNKFTNINLVSEVTEGKLIACNGSFIASSWNSTAGNVAILNTHFPSNVKFNCPALRGHKYSIFDLEFSSLINILLATASDDAAVKLWGIPPEGLTENLNKDLLTYSGYTRRVSFVKFNPVVADVIASGSTDYTLRVWNIAKGESYSQVEFGDLPTSLNWNPEGSLVGVTNKKKMINIFDPREKKSVLVTQI